MNLEKRGIFARTPFRKLQTSFEKPATSEGFADVLEVHFEASILYSCTLYSLLLTENIVGWE